MTKELLDLNITSDDLDGATPEMVAHVMWFTADNKLVTPQGETESTPSVENIYYFEQTYAEYIEELPAELCLLMKANYYQQLSEKIAMRDVEYLERDSLLYGQALEGKSDQSHPLYPKIACLFEGYRTYQNFLEEADIFDANPVLYLLDDEGAVLEADLCKKAQSLVDYQIITLFRAFCWFDYQKQTPMLQEPEEVDLGFVATILQSLAKT